MQLNVFFPKVNDVVIAVNDRTFMLCKIVSHFVRDGNSLYFEWLLKYCSSLCFVF